MLAGSSDQQNYQSTTEIIIKIIDLVNDMNDSVGGENVFCCDPRAVCHHHLTHGDHHHIDFDHIEHGDDDYDDDGGDNYDDDNDDNVNYDDDDDDDVDGDDDDDITFSGWVRYTVVLIWPPVDPSLAKSPSSWWRGKLSYQ